MKIFFTKISSIYKNIREFILLILFTSVLGILVVLGWQWGRQGIAQQIYRERLEAMQHEYTQLQARYTLLARKSAITELEVDETSVTIVVRNDLGELTRLTTSLNPELEIYVDYLVLHGRLWIRRVFDSSMSPDQATYVDPTLTGMNWPETQESLDYGKAVYRHLTPGRWVVTATGNGALGLAQLDKADPTTLAPDGFTLLDNHLMHSTADAVEEVHWIDVARWVLSQRPW